MFRCVLKLPCRTRRNQQESLLINEEIDEAVEGEDNNEGPEIEEDTSITDAIRQINCLRIGGEFERRKFENVGLVVNDNNDPLPENTPTERNNTDNE